MFSVGRYDPRTADKTAVSSKSSSYPRSSKGKTQKDKNHKRSKNNSKHGMGKAKTKQAEKKSGKGDDVPRIRTASKISARHTNIGNEIKDGTEISIISLLWKIADTELRTAKKKIAKI